MRTGNPMDSQLDVSYWLGHGLSLGAIAMTIAGVLPAVAALVAVIWYTIQIYESNTAQKWLEKRRMKRKARRVARIRAESKVLLAELEALETIREARVTAEGKVAVAAQEAATMLANANAHEKIHDGGKKIKSNPEPLPLHPKF